MTLARRDVAMVARDAGDCRRGDVIELVRRYSRKGEPWWECRRDGAAGLRHEVHVPEDALETVRG
jgi:hypothetical protein